MDFIGDKSFRKDLRVIVIPIMMQFLIQNFINFIDNIMVGSLGSHAIAGTAIANQYYSLFFPIITSIISAAAIYTVQFHGAKNYQKLKSVFGFKVIAPTIVTFLFVTIGLLFPVQIVSFFSDDQLTIQNGVNYLNIVIYSFIPYTISKSFSFTFRRTRRPKIPMIISSIAMISNLILNYMLIYGKFGFQVYGVKGAAIGTLIARLIELSLFLYIYYSKEHVFKGSFKDNFKFHPDLFIAVMRKVLPLLTNELLFTFANIIIFKAYSHHGTEAVTFISIAQTVGKIFFILLNGLGSATAALVGFELGAGNKSKALRHSRYLINHSIIMAIAITLLMLPSAFIIPSFYNINSELKTLVTYALIIRALVPLPLALTREIIFILKSGGKTREVVILDGIFMWVVKVPLALIASYVLDIHAIWIYLIVESQQFTNVLISLYFYKQKKWLNNLTTSF
jgi:putative MATE family efflux protein